MLDMPSLGVKVDDVLGRGPTGADTVSERSRTLRGRRLGAGVKVSQEITHIVSGIGPKVRRLRHQAGLSLQQLAELSNVSAAAIHKIEQNGMVPTITTLLKVAAALGRPVSYFVDEEEVPSDPTVHTPNSLRRPIYTSHTGIDLAGITGPYGRFFLAGARATVIAGAGSGDSPLEHPGEELIYILDGELEVVVNGRTYLLGPGDALHFRTVQQHSWRNAGERDTTALWMALRPQ
jgi:transcriptional regulator with XRE-family HTH domain